MIQPLFEHRLNLAGYETRVLELEGDGPPIVMFHGYADSADTWRRRSRCLRGGAAGRSPSTCRGSAPPILCAATRSCPNSTRSPPRRRGTPPAARRARDRGRQLARWLRLAPPRRAPRDRLAGVIAVAPAGLEMTRLLYMVQRDPVLHSLLARPDPGAGRRPPRRRGAAVRPARVRASGRVDPRVVSTFTWHHRERARVANYLDIAHRLIPELRTPFELDRITTRVLLVWGDRIGSSSTAAPSACSRRSGSRLELLRGVGHCPQVEAPERLTELLLEFCRGRRGRRAAAASKGHVVTHAPGARGPRLAVRARLGGGRRTAQPLGGRAGWTSASPSGRARRCRSAAPRCT